MKYEYVTEQTRPDLDWKPKPRAIYLPVELIKSDAFRELTKVETDLLLFIYTRRIFPSRQGKAKKKNYDQIDQWNPLNGREMRVPHVAITEFFNKPGIMRRPPPTSSTITRAIGKLMHVGFISLERMGGHGKGDSSVYRITHNWRVWRAGDKACFTRAGMSREKGFCKPNSGVFNPSKHSRNGAVKN